MIDDRDRARDALQAIDPGSDRESWVRAGMAAKSCGVDFADFDRWSSRADNYDARDCKSAWRSFKANGGVGAGTLFAMAKECGWQGASNGHARPTEWPQAAPKATGKAKAAPFDFASVWAHSEPAPIDHPYIARKLGLAVGLRVYRGDEKIAGVAIDGALLVPAYDARGVLQTWQAILPAGRKLNAKGRSVAGWFTIPGNGSTTYVCEGIGQAWSTHQATGATAVCAFGAGNFAKVAQALQSDHDLVIVSDVGKETQVAALASTLGCKWIAPPADLGEGADVNDLHVRDSLHAVADLLERADKAKQEQDSDAPAEIDIAALAMREPSPPRFLVEDRLPAGEVTLFAANGGTGKSQIELHLAVCLALQLDFFGVPVLQRNVDLISFEDRADIIHWRLHRICNALGVPMADLVGKLRLFDGTACLSAWFSRGQYGATGPTAAFHDIAERIGGSDHVVMVDGSSDTFAGNENDRAEVKAFIRMLRRLIGPDGALLLLAHVDKPSAKTGAESLGFSGSTGWSNGVRCRWFMFAEGDEEGTETGNVVMEVRKSNFGRTGARMVLRFDEESGVFQRVDAEPARRAPMFQESDEADAIVSVIRAAYQANDPVPSAASGQRTAHSVCEARGGLPGTLSGRSGRRRFYRALERLRAAGAVYVESFRRPNRHLSEVLNVRD